MRIFCRSVNRCGSFQPFVEIAVVPPGPAMPAFDLSGGNFEIAQKPQPLGFAHEPPHRWNHHVAAARITVGPEAVRPACAFRRRCGESGKWSDPRLIHRLTCASGPLAFSTDSPKRSAPSAE